VKSFLYFLLNYFDQIAIEKIGQVDYNDSVQYKKNESFIIFLKLFDFVLLYGIYYAIYKSIQFVVSLIIQQPTNSVTIWYFVVPVLYLIEVGLSKLNSVELINVLKYLLRASVKFSVIIAIDKLIILIISSLE